MKKKERKKEKKRKEKKNALTQSFCVTFIYPSFARSEHRLSLNIHSI